MLGWSIDAYLNRHKPLQDVSQVAREVESQHNTSMTTHNADGVPYTVLVEEEDDNVYRSKCGQHVMQREHGLSPGGNSFDGKWVYRCKGHLMGFDQYRNDLAERFWLRLDKFR
jgi:hypothetical protein